MRLAFSNLAWSPDQDAATWALLRDHGFTGVEVAPTKLWPEWQGATPAAAKAARQRLNDAGFSVPAMQAILFAQPDARLFDPAGERALEAHMAKVAALGGALGAEVAVWGAPKQRDCGTREFAAALDHAVPLCQRLAGIFADHGVSLCIEPNPRRYHCNFVWSTLQGIELVKAVAHTHFGLHLDSAALFLEQEALPDVWPSAAPYVRHFHISEPDLGDFAAPQVPHATNLKTLHKASYGGWCSVEMREPRAPLARVGPWQVLRQATHG